MKRLLIIISISFILTNCVRENIKNDPLREYLSKSSEFNYMLDTSRKINKELWDTTYLQKQHLHIYSYRADKLDGIGWFFLVEDSSKYFYTVSKETSHMDWSSVVNKDRALEMISDTIFQTEPLEYDLQEFESYLNKSYYYSIHSLDLEVLDTIIKMLYSSIDGMKILKDSSDINLAIKIYPDLKKDNYRMKLKMRLKEIVKQTNNRIYLLYSGQLLYVDYDPYYSGNLQSIIIGKDTVQINKSKELINRTSFLESPVNVRFIRIRY